MGHCKCGHGEWCANCTTLEKDFVSNQSKLDKAVELLIEVSEDWDNDKVSRYPEELSSFDELVCAIGNIKLNN